MHAVRSTAEYRARHALFIRRAANKGRRVAVHESPAPVPARIDHGRLLVDCECGAGNAVDRKANLALCFGCGAVHTSVVVPDKSEWSRIERCLLARRRQQDRNWHHSESIEFIEQANQTQFGVAP